jgi:hypothetical protein
MIDRTIRQILSNLQGQDGRVRRPASPPSWRSCGVLMSSRRTSRASRRRAGRRAGMRSLPQPSEPLDGRSKDPA